MNSNMHKAKKAKNDEFYTKYETVEKELINYKSQLENRIVYCNCDDYRVSNFYKYFKDNFENLKLKQLIATNYDIGKGSYKCIYDGKSEKITKLDGNGDFRSKECIDLLKQADIVCTNPPFSLFREYIAQIMEYEKKFLVIGNYGSVTYKEIFPLIKEGEILLGYTVNKTLEFQLANNYDKWNRLDKDGNKYGKVPAISWFTTLGKKIKREHIRLEKVYTGNEHLYPKYDNYNAIEVSKVKNIPKDYDGVMGVPITFLNIFNPNQFEILGMTKTPICYDNSTEAKRTKIYENVTQHSMNGKTSSGNKVNDASTLLLNNPPKNKTYYTANNIEGYLIASYARILIKNRKELNGSE